MTNRESKAIEVTARLGDLHIAPRKVRLVTDLINKKSVREAQKSLRFLTKKSARPLLKLINSAVANATHNFQLDPQILFIKNITVNQGRVIKRYAPRAQGRAFQVRHRTSRIDLMLAENPKLKTLKARVAGPATIVKKEPSVKNPSMEAAGAKQVQQIEAQKKRKFDSAKKFISALKYPLYIKRRLFNRKTNA